jgi:DNA-binding NtrC family response regulator
LKWLAYGLREVFPIFMAEYHQGAAGAPVIFVVDDEPMLLDLAEMVLKPAGFTIRTYEDPRRALADYAAAKPPPSLLVTDYAMMGMNGMDLMRECRKIHPEQKIILVSGTVDETIYANAEIKPDCFLAKPYDPEHFVAIVQGLTSD